MTSEIMSKSLQELAAEIREINQAKGWSLVVPEDWTDEDKIPARLALLHSEISEALEAFRGDNLGLFEEELIDVVIRALDILGGLSKDIDKALEDKMKANVRRPYQHGNRRL